MRQTCKIACVQWLIRELPGLDEFLSEVARHVARQAAEGADVVVFPELFSLGLLDPLKERWAAMEELAGHSRLLLRASAAAAGQYPFRLAAADRERRAVQRRQLLSSRRPARQ
jgi:predicted amidohydrolase